MRTLRQTLDCAEGVIASGRAPDLGTMTVLVVDDDLVSRKTMCQALAKVGVQAEAVSSAAEAAAALDCQPYALVLCDVLMADMNGFQFASQLRQHKERGETPIILVTMLADFDKVFHASPEGADDAIAKPFLLMEIAGKALSYLAPVTSDQR
jgi:two-component system, chemotaxis family, sensor histidine kinase and response regulator PixL